ncbi:membrane-bound lytic transglycosylase F [Salmonella enterica subsp. enterica serovar Choleraesuis str. 0006]|nr:membrane-bound lytic transglycosylase F [Salmonella enterica subsp. enterica serovar Choleraesuis str. 0006]
MTLLLAAALWPSIPWFGKTENHIAAIQARGVLRVSTIDSPLTYSVINGKNMVWTMNWRSSSPTISA